MIAASAVAKPEGTDAMSGSAFAAATAMCPSGGPGQELRTADNPDKSCPEAGCEVIVALFSLVLNAWFVFCPRLRFVLRLAISRQIVCSDVSQRV